MKGLPRLARGASPTMNSSTPADADRAGVPTVRVGRLAPLSGVALRDHPDRAHVKQLLRDLHLPMLSLRALLELCRDDAVPEPVRVALRAAENQAEYVQQLVEEFDECGRLEQDLVRPTPREVSLCDWLAARFEAVRAAARPLGIDVVPTLRSLMPSAVAFDPAMVQRALEAVVDVAVQRARAGRVDLRAAFEEACDQHDARLVFEVATRGGGFGEVERGYAFVPFRVRDAASRPLLGLTIGQRLCELLGGELSVESPGPSVCTYRLMVAAEPVADAVWLDPMRAADELGPVF